MNDEMNHPSFFLSPFLLLKKKKKKKKVGVFSLSFFTILSMGLFGLLSHPKSYGLN
jgi:hypothetical protein